METIINKAIEGGYVNLRVSKIKVKYNPKTGMVSVTFIDYEHDGTTTWNNTYHVTQLFCDPLFWQALSKLCGWNGLSLDTIAIEDFGKIIEPNEWVDKAMEFHFLNLTQGFDKAVEWLAEQVK